MWNKGFNSELSEAIRSGSLAQVKDIIQRQPDVLHFETPFGSWLDYAAREAKIDIVKWFVDKGLDVNRVNKGNTRPLCEASRGGNKDVVAYLLSVGAVPKPHTYEDEVANPIFGAISSKSPEIARLLVHHAQAPDVAHDYGRGKTVISFALLMGAPEVADVLAEYLAEGDAQRKLDILVKNSATADRQAPLKPVRIIPAVEDFDTND